MRARWWWGAAPLLVIALGVTYLAANAANAPLPRNWGGGTGSGPGQVGETRFLDVPLETTHPGAHITSVHAVGVTRHADVRIVATTFNQVGEMSSGYDVKCATGATRAASGMPIFGSREGNTDATVLRIEVTPTATGRQGFHSITIDWRRGLFHGHSTLHLAFFVRAREHYGNDTCN
jgi:hypothetical protein